MMNNSSSLKVYSGLFYFCML